jgi:F-type H+-transporting ATPase subunit a
MGHFSWFSLFAGQELAEQIEHSVIATLVAVFVVAFAVVVGGKIRNARSAIDPEDGVTSRNIGEAFVEMIAGISESVIGHHSEKYVPLLGSLFVFIFVSNILGLIPGVPPPTSNSNVTFGLGAVSFLAYHFYGLKEQGGAYLKHFLGPIIFLAPLFLLIEIFSHAFRPLSLGIRLYANMYADHQVLGIFTDLTKIGVPVIFYALGAFVCVVQSFVFTMLTGIYISLAVSHDH